MHTYTDTNQNHSRDLELLSRLRPIDDEFMRCIFKDDLQLVCFVLRTLTGIESLELERMQTQYDMKRLVGSRSVILDVWGKDSKGTLYNLEIQRGDKPYPKRARYHSAALDVDSLDTSQSFDTLPETYVIFIVENDPFGEGEGIYHFTRFDTNRGIELLDGTHILYANAAYRADNEFGRLMHDFCETDPKAMLSLPLAEKVSHLKSSPEGVSKMSQIMEEYLEKYMEEHRDEIREEVRAEERAEGRAEGREQSVLLSIKSLMHTLKLTSQQAMDALQIPAAERPRYLSML